MFQHLTLAAVIAGVAKTRVNLLVTHLAVVTRCTLTLEVLELHGVADAAVLTRLGQTHVTLPGYHWVRVSWRHSGNMTIINTLIIFTNETT